jgi:DNA repair protein RadC
VKTIKEIPEYDRPRERLRAKGAAALSDEELVQLILGRGVEGHDVRSMSKQIARIVQEKKNGLTETDLTAIPGMGPAKAYQLIAAFELARRHLIKDTIKITKATDVLPLLTDITTKQQEYFVCISLNGANEVIEKRVVTIGLLNRSQVHPREVFADVIADRAASVIFAHNHPSGELNPSDADLKIHEQLIQAAKILGIRVLDQIIVTKKGHCSFQEIGLIE